MSGKPPEVLDGARVKLFASLGAMQQATGATRHSVRNFAEVVKNLAIARYDDETDFYLFYCTDDWNVVADTNHPSEAEAISQAEFEFANVSFTPIDPPSQGGIT